MKNSRLEQMSQVTSAIYLSELQKVQKILNEESRLRKELSRLDAQSEAGRQAAAKDLSIQTVGADFLWQAWLSRTRRQLNIELAQVMAQKLTAIGRVRNAFGRKTSVQSICASIQKEQRKANQKNALEVILRKG